MAQGTAKRSRPSLAAEAAFRERLEELGAELLEPEWLGSGKRHYVRCRAGHDCYPMPSNLRSGQGPCRTCAGQDSAVVAEAFRGRLDALGATLLEPEWLGNQRKHHVRCSAGHDCYPRPNDVQQRGGICRICSGCDSATAEAAFNARLAELGAVLLEPVWLGVMRSHRVRCASGHDCSPRPNDVQQGHGICLTCAGKDPAVAEARFRQQLTEVRAIPLYAMWLGVSRGHHVRCRNGHDCYPWPGSVNAGQGVCFTCAYSGEWDAFYVVTSATGVKFGVTSGSPRKRLGDHARQGYTEVVRLVTGLPGTVAPDAERAVKAALALAGEKPVHGKEYFDISCLALILDVVAGWLDPPQAA
jgi:hypothetical protein